MRYLSLWGVWCFVSSRRRHTRCSRDWSSDVCSSDLFSMRARTRFGDAKQKALALLAGKPHGQKAQIMSLGGQLEVRTAAITDDAPLRAALENIQPGDGHASFGELGQAMRSLAETEPGPIELHLFSDMQRTAMPSNLSEAVLPNNVELVLHPVADGPAPANWTVESVEAPATRSEEHTSELQSRLHL